MYHISLANILQAKADFHAENGKQPDTIVFSTSQEVVLDEEWLVGDCTLSDVSVAGMQVKVHMSDDDSFVVQRLAEARIVNGLDKRFQEALQAVTGTVPPRHFKIHFEEQFDEIQQWCADHAKPSWSTGIAIFEAAENIVDEAVGNCNLTPEGDLG